MSQDQMKKSAAVAAIEFVGDGDIVGVGTGSTANFFIDELAHKKSSLKGAVASSEETASRLKQHGIKVYDLNDVDSIRVYIDGADEINGAFEMIKGGGGALTREKIVAAVAEQFVCIVDETKLVETLGKFPLPIEVIPMAREYVARCLADLGGKPVLRKDFITDNGNVIIDVEGLSLTDAASFENKVNGIVGVVTNGLFALRPADVLIVGAAGGARVSQRALVTS